MNQFVGNMSFTGAKPPSPPSHPLSDIYPSPSTSPSPSLAPVSILPPSPPSTSHSTSSAHHTLQHPEDTTAPSPTEDSNVSPSPDVRLPEHDTIISDIPRIRQTHSTAGYRDGITEGKAETIQQGFDEGVSLGGEFGLKVGELEGLVVGVVDALRAGSQGAQNAAGSQVIRGRISEDKEDHVVELKTRRGASSEATEQEGTFDESSGGAGRPDTLLSRFQKLLNELRAALSVENIFAREYFDERGVWKYPLIGPSGSPLDNTNAEGGGKDEAEGISFKDVVAAHPLLRDWDARVKMELHSIKVFSTYEEN